MAKTILIELKGKDVSASKATKRVKEEIKTLGKQTKVTTAKMSTDIESLETKLNRMGNKFRFMSIAFTMLATGSVALGRTFITSAIEMEQAQLKLGVFAASAGENFKEVTAAAMKLYSTGLIPLQDASEGLANLLATGLGLDKSIKLMDTFLNAAVVAKESLTDTFGRAIVKATLGVRIFQERQIDSIGINTRLDMVFRDYGKTIGVVSTELTNAQRYQAIYNFYMKEGTRYAGAAQLATETFSGALSRLKSTSTMMSAAIGATLIPLVGSVADMLMKVTRTVATLAETFPGLTSAVISGSIALSVLGASLAAVGAIVPLVTTGLKVMGIKTLATLGPALWAMTWKAAALAAAIGTLGYFVLRVTGKWKQWSDAIKNLSDRIAEIINPMSKLTEEIEENNKKLTKTLETLERNLRLTYRSFMENMAEWAQKHTETINDLRADISNLEKDYKKATSEITQHFNDMMSDLTLRHTRKTEDLQREIAEEVSKGIWANQSRIRDLKRRLKRENEDYALSSTQKEKIRKDDLAEEKSEYSEKLTKLQAELDKELAMEKKHANAIAAVRDVTILDEVEKRVRAFNERIEQLKKEYALSKEVSASKVADLLNLGTEQDKMTDAIDKTLKKQKELNLFVAEAIPDWKSDIALVAASFAIIGIGIKVLTAGIIGYSIKIVGIGATMAKITIAIEAMGAALVALPWAIFVAAALYATGQIIKHGVNPLNEEVAKTTELFEKNRAKLDVLAQKLITSYKDGTINQTEYREGMQQLLVEYDDLTDRIEEFNNAISPYKLEFWKDGFVAVGEYIKDKLLVTLAELQETISTPMTIGVPKFKQPGPQYNIEKGMTSPDRDNRYLFSSMPYKHDPFSYSDQLWQKFAKGGVVSGALNQPIPIIAHGGETVLPAGVAPITVNINNPSVRSDADIRSIAMMVKDVLSSQQRYRHIT